MKSSFISNTSIEQGKWLQKLPMWKILKRLKMTILKKKKRRKYFAEVYDRRKIVDIDKPVPEETENILLMKVLKIRKISSGEKIKLANIKGLKAVQSLFDDDPLKKRTPKERTA
jgi:hypothetical protein